MLHAKMKKNVKISYIKMIDKKCLYCESKIKIQYVRACFDCPHCGKSLQSNIGFILVGETLLWIFIVLPVMLSVFGDKCEISNILINSLCMGILVAIGSLIVLSPIIFFTLRFEKAASSKAQK